MYRQIKVAEKYQEYQYILWRDDPKLPISEFKLTTVTYGTSAAPFLAVRCLRELADRFCQEDSVLAETIRDDFYMDDLITGGDTVNECYELKRKLRQVMEKARMHLRKWVANDERIFIRHSGRRCYEENLH